VDEQVEISVASDTWNLEKEESMKRAGSKRRCFVVIAAVMSLMVFAVPILAQQGDITAGRMAGSQAAKANTNGTLWLAVGCLGGIVGVAVAYVVDSQPSATMLLGKSPEYVAAYSDAYRATGKSVQTGKAWTGCLLSALVYVGLAVLAAIADEAI